MSRNYRQLHVLLKQQPGAEMLDISDFKIDLAFRFSSGRTQDVKRLTDAEYNALVGSLRRNSMRTNKMDKLRKRVLASMFGFFKLIDKPVTLNYVKAIAVRAAGNKCNNFNNISESKLRAIYNEFLRQQKVVNNIGKIEAIAQMDPNLLRISGIQVTVKETKGAC